MIGTGNAPLGLLCSNTGCPIPGTHPVSMHTAANPPRAVALPPPRRTRDPPPLTRIPFLPEFEEKVRLGLKTMTARTKPYGKRGDLFQGPRCVLRLTEDPRRVYLATVKWQHYRQEGCGSPEEFEAVWKGIHPRKGYDGDQLVWLHHFEVLKPWPRGENV